VEKKNTTLKNTRQKFSNTKMTATMSALYSPRDNPWSSPSKDHKACLSPFFSTQKDHGLWNNNASQTTPTVTQPKDSDISWGTAATPLDLSFLETPTEVNVPHDWSDEVSLLNDNPEEDDIEVLYLPRSTYDVLSPLFDELFIDTSQEDDDDDHQEEDLEGCTVAS
jgi:hypothetical protein